MNKEQTKEKLRAQIFEGENAKALLKQLDPRFVQIREQYRSDLVHSVRTKADEKAILMDACKIAALEDLYETIYQDAVTGARAQEKATQIEQSEAT